MANFISYVNFGHVKGQINMNWAKLASYTKTRVLGTKMINTF
jgi:hypothetical protein